MVHVDTDCAASVWLPAAFSSACAMASLFAVRTALQVRAGVVSSGVE